jgi:hypothetical protein
MAHTEEKKQRYKERALQLLLFFLLVGGRITEEKIQLRKECMTQKYIL